MVLPSFSRRENPTEKWIARCLAHKKLTGHSLLLENETEDHHTILHPPNICTRMAPPSPSVQLYLGAELLVFLGVGPDLTGLAPSQRSQGTQLFSLPLLTCAHHRKVRL